MGPGHVALPLKADAGNKTFQTQPGGESRVLSISNENTGGDVCIAKPINF